MTNPNNLVGESGYCKPFALGVTAWLTPLTTYRLVIGVLTGLLVSYGVAVAAAINSLSTR